MTQFERIDELIKNQNGIIRTAQIIEAGISKQTFYLYIKERELEQTAPIATSFGFDSHFLK